MKKKIIIISLLIIVVISFYFFIKAILWYQALAYERALLKEQNEAQNRVIEYILDSRRIDNSENQLVDPFGEDGIVQILFIGLDSRVGQKNGNCDAIQLISIDKNKNEITITAVPRGTYSPLPPGTGTTSSDYYVSNACGLGGLEYGIKQIEKILETKADYLVMLGFSETLGILRYLRLPTAETLQWLRNRHGYTIGEPQRAHNHSTFIKQMMIRFVPTEKSILNTPLQYIIYKLVKTDLSFDQTQIILDAISKMDIVNNPEIIKLTMRPLYPVQDIVYNTEKVGEYLDQTIGPIKHLLSKDDYFDISEETLQAKLISIIDENRGNLEFISWAYQNNLWLQIEDNNESLMVQYGLFEDYLKLLTDKKERRTLIADYILEMQNRQESLWEEKAKKLLEQEMGY